MASAESPVKVAIFGSCVTRDAFAFAPKPGFEVAEYIARSSMASAFHQVPMDGRYLSAVERIDSPFQRRMVECDLLKLARQRLLASSADVVLIDLIDERFDLALLGGSFATWSSEFSKLGFERGEFDAVYRIGSEERKPLWRQGAEAMLQALGTDRVVLNEVYWARELPDGQSMERADQIDRANDQLREMHAFLRSLGVERSITYPSELLRADPDHKWGLSPFHFVADFYEFTMESLQRC
jgi:hypothetical protein